MPKKTGQPKCECKIVGAKKYDGFNNEIEAIIYCPLHASAGELLEACKHMRKWMNCPPDKIYTIDPQYLTADGKSLADVCKITDEAITKAEGR